MLIINNNKTINFEERKVNLLHLLHVGLNFKRVVLAKFWFLILECKPAKRYCKESYLVTSVATKA